MQPGRLLIAAVLVAVGWAGCKHEATTSVALTTAQHLTERCNPTAFVESLRKAGGAEVSSTLTIRVEATEQTAGLNPPQDLTTETQLRMDRTGNFSLEETNNLDNGRIVVLQNDVLSVQLKYGKLVRHPAREPEPTHILQEALGGPFTIWELLASLHGIVTEKAEAGTIRFTLKPDVTGTATAGPGPLRSWREGATIKSGAGEVVIDEATGLPTEARLHLGFRASRNNHPVTGHLDVRFSLKNIGGVPELSAPDAGDLPTHQRTLLQERMLNGLSGRRDPAKITP